MGLRDRLRLLVRPAPAPAPVRASEPPKPPPRPALLAPAAWAAVPPGATVVDVGTGPVRAGARRIPPAGYAELRGVVVVVGGAWAPAAAERIASYGHAEVGWLVEGGA